MRPGHRNSILVTAAAFALLLMGLAPTGIGAQTSSRAPRTADSKPNLNGIWQVLNEAEWDIEGHSAAPGRVLALGAEDAVVPGLGVVEGGPLPYLPQSAYQSKYRARRE